MHPRRNQQTRPTYAGRPSPIVDPVALHALHKAKGVGGDELEFITEFKLRGEAGEIEGGVDEWELDVEDADEFEEGGAECEDVGVKDIAEVDEHV